MSRASDIFQRILNGRSAEIMQMIDTLHTEELFLDYKRSSDQGLGRSLHNTDRANLSKAVSGFGNSEGGVVIWGVDCRNDRDRGDVPNSVHLIHNPIRFKSWLEQATTGTTVPPHDGVRHEAIYQDGETEGFVVSYIPKGSHIPYQTIPDLRFLMRSGSNFAPVPHGVLAGMFGRQPQADVFPTFIMEQNFQPIRNLFSFTLGIGIHNKGPGIAEDAFLNLHVVNTGGRGNRIEIESDNNGMWTSSNYLSVMWNFILKREYRLSPDATSMPAIVRMNLMPPFSRNLRVKISAGANGSVPYRSEWSVSGEELTELYESVRRAQPDQVVELSRRFVERIARM